MATVLKRTPETNLGETERWASLLGGATLAVYGLSRRGTAGFSLAAIGGGLLLRGATGHCSMYQALGINTAQRDLESREKGTGRHVAVPYELGIRVDAEVRIERSPEELYQFWRNLENLPRFMKNLESVEVRSEHLSHWVVRGPAGMNVSWDAEIINEIENRLIGWRSLPGAQVDNGGSVHFEPTGDGSTSVRVSLQYNPPAGGIGAKLARLFADDPAQQIREDLARFREIMETGAIACQTTGKTPRKQKKEKVWDRDNVQNASEESFPASDAPSWTPEAL